MQLKIGDFEVSLISDGTFALDGGAMFGVVPRVLWEKRMQPDERNRIRLGLNCLLIRTGRENVLIDTGCGFKYTEKQRSIYDISHETSIFAELDRLDLSPEDIHWVINTHLHFDHCGGNTILRDGGTSEPAFPRARYVVQQEEFEEAEHANERNRASYLPENWRPIREAGQLETINGPVEILPGIHLEPTPGHTLGHQSVRIESGNQTLFYIADLCPTTAHVPLAWVMGYDLFPLTTMETRRRIYRRAIGEDWLIFFEHDAESPLGRLELQDGKFACHTLSRDGSAT
ncbi:MAG: MBL fold metallo-hydrolase [Acidobacteriota bacterium]